MYILKNANARPFLKWAGGKGQLLTQLEVNFPQKLKEHKVKKYVEPFLGGGAVFFELNKHYQFEQVILNDFNVELIITYKVIRDSVNDLISKLSVMESSFLEKNREQREAMYYEIRSLFNLEKRTIDYSKPSQDWITHASNLIFLNKTCFNGLYRLNSKGDYNVPFGDNKNPTICDKDNLKNVNLALQGVTLLHGDFELLTDYIDKDTFVYMDPPYRPLSGTSSFNNYQKSPFNDDSQKRLAAWYTKLHNDKKASLMLSNSDPTNTDPTDTFFEELYKQFSITKLSASRAINSKGNGRGSINELLITNEALLNEEESKSIPKIEPETAIYNCIPKNQIVADTTQNVLSKSFL